MEALVEYGLFVAKLATVLVLVALTLVSIILGVKGQRGGRKGQLEIQHLNQHFEEVATAIKEHILSPEQLKLERKEQKKRVKSKEEQAKRAESKRIYVLDFVGDMRAHAVDKLREEITAVLSVARAGEDEVLLRLESPGGVVHGYGLAAAQLMRLREAGIAVTVAVDKVAASGGYLMACVADRILAAPFAIIGSIGVVAQIPNIHRLLKKNDIDVELLTAGEYKRTLTVLGENTEKGREKFLQDLEETHRLFKEQVQQCRPQLEIEKVATGEVWYGSQALSLNLVDQLMTSDQWVQQSCQHAQVYWVRYQQPRNWQDKLGLAATAVLDAVERKWGQWTRIGRVSH
ncbi:protease SohB [Balneatrix alpica]|uniref:protease SohB n=1 Tax=Balneatrix alpica TaxID=75684 RepID=UPI002738FBC8|nr:protease SohB [Balneatrix alpica]